MDKMSQRKFKISLIGYKGFIGQRIIENDNQFEYDLLSKKDFYSPEKKNKIDDIIKNSDLIVLLTFINSNSLSEKMYQNFSFCDKLFKYIDKYNKKFLFLSSDSADHAATPYGRSKIECENLFNNLRNFWYIRPGPVYFRKNMEFKGVFGKFLSYKFKILPLPLAGNFTVKLFSIEEIVDLFMLILNDKVKVGEIKIKKIVLRDFLLNKFPNIHILNIPSFFIRLILAMPNVIKYKIPIEIVFTSKIK